MINRAKLQHILEYAKQQRHIGLHCKVPPEDMVEIVEMAMLQGAAPVSQPDRDAYGIESFGIFSATEGRDGLNLSIEQFHFGTENCPPAGKKNFVPKFALQAIINRLQEHGDSMSSECSIDVLSGLAAPQQEAE